MELWIRSQNKECLMKVEKLDLDNDKTGIFCYSYDDMSLMGKYKTKERALEVLDEIQNILKPKIFVRANEDNEKILLGGLQHGVTQKVDMEFKEL